MRGAMLGSAMESALGLTGKNPCDAFATTSEEEGSAVQSHIISPVSQHYLTVSQHYLTSILRVLAGLGVTCVMQGGGWGVAVLLWCEGTP